MFTIKHGAEVVDSDGKHLILGKNLLVDLPEHISLWPISVEDNEHEFTECINGRIGLAS
jgi:hypothetical protein